MMETEGMKASRESNERALAQIAQCFEKMLDFEKEKMESNYAFEKEKLESNYRLERKLDELISLMNEKR